MKTALTFVASIAMIGAAHAQSISTNTPALQMSAAEKADADLAESVRVCRMHRHIDPNGKSLPHHPPFVWDEGWDHCEGLETAFRDGNAAREAKAKRDAEPERQRTIDAAKRVGADR